MSSTTAKIESGITKVTMPAGEYWLGDPCYTVPRERWMEWLENADYTNQRILIADLDGHPVLGIGTAYGDGVYSASDGEDVPVDAGLIGLVPVALVGLTNIRSDLVHLVTYDQPFECRYENGRIVLGHIWIDTED